MSFGYQLRTLLWKYLLIRRRSWIRTSLEIILPSVIFIIFLIVKAATFTGVEYHPTCYGSDRAMMSVGILPFVQSLFCQIDTVNKKCGKSESDFKFVNTYNGSILSDIYEELAESFGKHSPTSQIPPLEKVGVELLTLKEMSDKYIQGQPLQASPVIEPISKLFLDVERARGLLLEWSSQSPDKSKSGEWTSDDVDAILRGTLKPLAVSPAVLLALLANNPDPAAICNSEAINKIFVPNTSSSSNRLQKGSNLLDPICKTPAPRLGWLANSLKTNINWDSLETEMKRVVRENGGNGLDFDDWMKISELATNIGQDLLLTKPVRKLLGGIVDAANVTSSRYETLDLEGYGDEFSTIVKQFAIGQQLFCGNGDVLDGFKFGMNRVKALLKRFGLESLGGDPINIRETDVEQCNAALKDFGIANSTVFSHTWDMLRPLLVGKVLYAPNTRATRKIMTIASQTFDPLVKFKAMVDAIANHDQVFTQIAEDPRAVDLIREVINNSGKAETPLTAALEQVGGKDLVDDMVKLGNSMLSGLPVSDVTGGGGGNTMDMTTNAGIVSTLNWIQKMAKFASKLVTCIELDRFQAFETEKELELESLKLRSNDTNSAFLAGIVFVDFPKGNTTDSPPPLTRYKIRMDKDEGPDPHVIYNKYGTQEGIQPPSKYITSGFQYLQDIVERSIIAAQSDREFYAVPGSLLQAFPYPCYAVDKFNQNLQMMLPLVWTVAFIFTAINVVRFLVQEKEERLKETMKVMGLTNAVFWVAALIDGLTFFGAAILILTTILKFSGIFYFSDGFLALFIFFSYGVAVISFSFLISTLFNTTVKATICTVFIFLLSNFFDGLINQNVENMSLSVLRILSLNFNTGLSFATRGIVGAEQKGLAKDWSNILDPISDKNQLTMLNVIAMFWLDAAINFTIAWYIENVFPGSYGHPRPWYFCVTLDYWWPSWRSRRVAAVSADSSSYDPTAAAAALANLELGHAEGHEVKAEKEPKHLKLGVAVQNLSKVYDNGKSAVENLSVNFYEGQLTSFLGHNGAGKTTTLSMLMGILTPSAGTAKILGLDIMEDMDEIRKSIGMCPQHNVLFDLLTVEEHLQFYGQLRGRSPKDIKAESEEMLKSLDLEKKRRALAGTLSGGMKRKLSIATAFVGQSKVVVLDEPTAGVDPYARRAIWDVLLKYKKERTIIMSTHFMDEADLLGDRIAIINEGKLVCVGSSIFLRSAYGNGYYLTLVVNENSDDQHNHQSQNGVNGVYPTNDVDNDILHVEPAAAAVGAVGNGAAVVSGNDDDTDVSDDEGVELSLRADGRDATGAGANPPSTPRRPSVANGGGVASRQGGHHGVQFSTVADQATAFVCKYVPDSTLIEQRGSELVYVLPTHHMARYESLLSALETESQRLGIRSYGVSDTTLEEIFLKVANDKVSDRGMTKVLSHEDIREAGRIPCRVRSASSRSADPQIGDMELKGSHAGSANVKVNCPPPAAVESKKPRWLKHFFAMTIKRIIYAKRSPLLLFLQFIVPIVLTCFALLGTRPYNFSQNEPVEIQPWLYVKDQQADKLYSVVSNGFDGAKWPEKYVDQLLTENGMATKCVQYSTMKDTHCSGEPAKPFNNMTISVPRRSAAMPFGGERGEGAPPPQGCQCLRQGMVCDSNPRPPSTQLASYDHLQDLSGQSVSRYLVKNRKDRTVARKGGFEFGVGSVLAGIDVDKLTNATSAILTSLNMSWADVVVNPFIQNAILSSPGDNVRVWFDDTAFGTEAAYLNAANNAILRASIEAQREDDFSMDFSSDFDDFSDHGYHETSAYGISLSVQPINNTPEQNKNQRLRAQMYDMFASTAFAFNFVMALVISTSTVVSVLIEEKISKSKHLQYISGVKPATYWISAFVWDFTIYWLTIPILVALLVLMGEKYLTGAELLPAFLTLICAFGFSTIPFVYLESWLFSVPGTAIGWIAAINLLLTIGPSTISMIFNYYMQDEYTGNILDSIFIFFPQYCVTYAVIGLLIRAMAMSQGFADSTGQMGIWDMDVTGKYILSMFACGVVYLVILAILEYRWFAILRKLICGVGGPPAAAARNGGHDGNGFKSVLRKIFCCGDSYDVNKEEEAGVDGERADEADVIAEQNRIESMERIGVTLQPLMLTRLTKYFEGKRPAVNNLTFGVEPRECFGLLGVNGAGKTTTFKMLTGDESPSSGDAFINGHSILTSLNAARRNVGYCPQFDALFDKLTAKEHLTFYSRIKGLDEASTQKFVQWCVTRLDLLAYADTIASTYSGGNKRKLSTAISFVGNPAIVFLDEPTAGMDAAARRFLWNCITDVVRNDRSVILTSHSMEECEALCSRLVIMVNGKFVCHGSTQHLKNRYGSGYSLTVRAKDSLRLDEVRRLVDDHFPDNQLKEEHSNQLLFQLPLAAGILPKVFKVLQEAKINPNNSLEDFSISQLTLDDVFIHFAKNQDSGDSGSVNLQ